MVDRSVTDGIVYFLQGTTTHRIKIWFTRSDVFKRMDSIAVSCPENLRLIGVSQGSLFHEKALHGLLREHRIKGEWFDNSDEVVSTIKKIFERVAREGKWYIPPIEKVLAAA